MINAYFDTAQSRATAISGVYQYDTGQRLRLLGLPSKGEIGLTDELIGTEMEEPAVQVHFGYEGDPEVVVGVANTVPGDDAWYVDIPDEYFTKTEPVHVYVYVYFGDAETERENEDGEIVKETISRGRTVYEGVFTPISRPAANNTITPGILEAWEVLLGKISDATSLMDPAISNAKTNAAASLAAAENLKEPIKAVQEAAAKTQEATERLNDAGSEWRYARVSAESISSDNRRASVSVADEGDIRHFKFKIPRGEDGIDGAVGDTGPADILLEFNTNTDKLTITTLEVE